jgi:sphingomyelin phosphodiesterase acid-like 3
MQGKPANGILRCCAKWRLLTFCFALAVSAQSGSAREVASAEKSVVPVLMVSDIHFEPFSDPSKAAQLAAAPVSRWAAILGGAPSPDRAARFAALQKTCHAKGFDTDYTLFASSLRAMREHASGALFITLSGDLLAHDFDCKYSVAVPHATAAGNEAFAAKTLVFVMEQFRKAFPRKPMYAALGNNDSGCGDYHLTAGNSFLKATAPAMVADVPAADRDLAQSDYVSGGYYSAMLPAPMEHTRLLVLEDLFMSEGYKTCGSKADPLPAAEQIAWLRSQLERARRDHEKVWVMAHIPPGIDPYSTIRKMVNVCAAGAPEMFLSSDALPATIADFADVVRLAIFGHTHMDELRLLRADAAGGQESAVALKIVPSISPVDGNNPAFVVGSVVHTSAVLKDYRVIAASNQTGAGTVWREKYDFDRAYSVSEFSAASLKALIADFRADGMADNAASDEYLRNFFVGDRSALLKLFWPEYTCTLENDTAAGFRSCMCGEKAGSGD